MSVTDAPELHDHLGPLAGWLGTFEGDGEGDYPTIQPFRYREQVTFSHVGKPFLVYQQRTWHPETGAPMHAEVGYLRLLGGHAELVLAHPTGIAEVEEGDLVGGTLHLASTAVGRSSTALPVRTLRRRIALEDDTLSYDLWMAHADVPETHHLAATLHRVG